MKFNSKDPCLMRPFGRGGIPDNLQFKLWLPDDKASFTPSWVFPDMGDAYPNIGLELISKTNEGLMFRIFGAN